MAIKDYWLYQERNVPVPWAIYFVKEYDRRYSDIVTIDYTIYHENIPNSTHSKSFIGLNYDSPEGYANAIATEMMEYFPINSDDYQQVLQEIKRILA